jgi:hypothetical protein
MTRTRANHNGAQPSLVPPEERVRVAPETSVADSYPKLLHALAREDDTGDNVLGNF